MAFGDGSLSDRDRLREPNVVSDEVRHGRIYWLYGASPDPLHPSEVADPPCSGWGAVFLLDETDRTVRLYAPWEMKSWVVSKGAYELLSLQGTFEGFNMRARQYFMLSLPKYWAEAKLRGWDKDFATAERVMAAVGCKPPPEEEWRRLAGQAVQRSRPSLVLASGSAPVMQQAVGGKPPAKEAEGLKKPVKRTGRKGEVLAFFMEKSSINEAMAKFGVTRSNLLSQLFLLRKDHGIGYTVEGDSARVELPAGITDPFEKEDA
jgi:hypothetical protein